MKPEEKEKKVTVPEKIDYGTGAVLVDIVPVNDWSGSGKLTTRDYYDMLYSFDGMNIEHMPVKAMYWIMAWILEHQGVPRLHCQAPP